ncbi:hypothetical protein QL285_082302 [Trifolium repens]|nr:hypothetical protein QL285_082302 [Trifolium repens]
MKQQPKRRTIKREYQSQTNISNPTQLNQTNCELSPTKQIQIASFRSPDKLRAFAHQTNCELSLTKQIANFRSPNKQFVSTILTHQIDQTKWNQTKRSQTKPNETKQN